MWYVSERFPARVRQKNLQQLGLSIYALLLFLFASLVIGCGGAPQNPADDGEGLARMALSSDSVLDLGRVLKDFESQHTITLENQSFAVTASNISVSEGFVMPYTFSGGVYPGTGGTCAETLAPGVSCTLVISIIPNAEGIFGESLSLDYNDGAGNQTLTLSLTADSYEPQPASLTISDAPIFDFGQPAIGSINDKIFTITNSGDLAATAVVAGALTAPFSYAGGAYPGTGGDCGASISSGSCIVAVQFAPTSTVTENTTLTLDYNDGIVAQSTNRPITGQGRVAANIIVQEGLIFDFQTLLASQTVSQTLTLENNGGEPATSLSISSLGTGYSHIGGNCGAQLNVAATCTMIIQFAPLSTVSLNSSPRISYNDSFFVQNIDITLQGEGFGNALNLQRTAPATTPNTLSTPTVRVGALIPNLQVRLYRDTLCTQLAGTLNSAGSSLDFNPILTEGSFTFKATAEDDYGNRTPCSAASAGYTYDNTNPNPVSNVVMNADYTSFASATPTFTWNHSGSADRTDYEVGLSVNAAGGNDVAGWTSKGLVTSTNITGLSLSECSYYYASIQVIDQVGLASSLAVASPRFRYDSAPPTTPISLNTSGDATDTNSATISWAASADACGIDHYEIAIGQDTNGNLNLEASEVQNVIAFKDIGNVISHRENGMTLNTAVNYYTTVRAVDTTGRISAEATSPPYIIYDPSIELPDMIVWLDGGDPTTILDSAGRDANNGSFSGSVRTWVDKSGSTTSHNFSTSSGAADPLFDDANYSLFFNGTNTGMTTADHPEINTATVTQRNITVAFQSSADITTRQILYEEGGTIRGMNIYIANGRLYCGFYNTPNDGDGAQPFASVNRTISTNSIYFVTWVFDYTNFTNGAGPDGNLDCYVNDTNIGNIPTTSRLFAHSGDVGLGRVDNDTCFEDGSCTSSGFPFLGDIYEVMLFNNAPGATEVSNVHTYLDNKWN